MRSTMSDTSQSSRKRRRRVMGWLLLVALLLLATVLGYDRLRSTPADASVKGASAARGDPAPSVAAAAPPRLDFEVSDDGRRVKGRFGAVRFESEALAEERARARFWMDTADGESLEVVIDSATDGAVRWRGTVVSGRGAIPDDTAAMLGSLAAGPLGDALVRIPLDLACQPEADLVAPAVGASLLMPWQVLLKYGPVDPAAAARERSETSVCGYFGRKARAGLLEVPNPNVVMLSGEDRIPVAATFLPLDGAGQRGHRP